MPPEMQDGAHQGDFPIKFVRTSMSGHPFQTSQSCAAQEVHQDRFDLVVCGVTDGHNAGLV
jgi:broad specificity polyphosphatase/5'/3'-nucleotidase SurE